MNVTDENIRLLEQLTRTLEVLREDERLGLVDAEAGVTLDQEAEALVLRCIAMLCKQMAESSQGPSE